MSWSAIIMSWSCTISENNNDPIFRKLSDCRTDRQTDGQTDGQTDKSDFIGCCPTNAKSPIIYVNNFAKPLTQLNKFVFIKHLIIRNQIDTLNRLCKEEYFF